MWHRPWGFGFGFFPFFFILLCFFLLRRAFWGPALGTDTLPRRHPAAVRGVASARARTRRPAAGAGPGANA
jgi:hypothetical protein